MWPVLVNLGRHPPPPAASPPPVPACPPGTRPLSSGGWVGCYHAQCAHKLLRVPPSAAGPALESSSHSAALSPVHSDPGPQAPLLLPPCPPRPCPIGSIGQLWHPFYGHVGSHMLTVAPVTAAPHCIPTPRNGCVSRADPGRSLSIALPPCPWSFPWWSVNQASSLLSAPGRSRTAVAPSGGSHRDTRASGGPSGPTAGSAQGRFLAESGLDGTSTRQL